MGSVIIEGIKPYNEIFYKSCFFNCYFSIVKYLNQDILVYLFNDVNAYTLNSENLINIENIPFNDPEIIAKEQGIRYKKRHHSNNLIQDLKFDLKQKRPVLIWLDPYLQSNKNKLITNHRRHCVLIIGFDDEEQKFDIIDNKYLDNLSYERTQKTYIDIKSEYENFKNYFQPDDNFHTYTAFESELENKVNKNINDCIMNYLENVNINIDKLEKGLSDLTEFMQNFSNEVNTFEFLESVNNIINVKKSERYRMNLIKKHPDIDVSYVNLIVKDWEKARYIIAKSYFRDEWDYQSEGHIKKLLNNIIANEQCEIHRLKQNIKRGVTK